MTTAPAETPPRSQASDDEQEPGHHMTIGEHLEELRSRLIRGLIGFGVAAVVCMAFGKSVVAFFCWPLWRSLAANNLNPELFTHGLEDAFVVYIKVSLITAAAISAPWMVYQLWLFIAAGLYPHERKYVTQYIPLSITLLISGMVFMYLFVLPITINFFLLFNIAAPRMQFPTGPRPATAPAVMKVPQVAEDPASPADGQIWYNAGERRLKFFINDHTAVLLLGNNQGSSPMPTLDDYISMVINLLIAFGVAFQLPLVVMALARVGIVDIPTLRAWRRYVYFSMAVLAAFIIPDVVTGMLALMVPLIGLYELGILLAIWSERRRAE